MVTNATFVKTTKTNKPAQQIKTQHKGKDWVRIDKRNIPEDKN